VKQFNNGIGTAKIRIGGIRPSITFTVTTVIGWIIIGSWLIDCAAGKSPHPPPAREVVILERSPSLNQGEPVPNGEMAVDLAELALTQKGIDCRDFVPRVSFFEDVYQVTFDSKSDLKGYPTYKVEINAKTSEVIKAVRLEK
jgi:hypothetical protein